MSIWEVVAILFAGVGAGAINAVVGSGTLITFPTLIAFGFPPVTATMTNAVGLVAGGVSGTWGYRRELAGQWPRLKWQIPASLVGAIIGSWLLLHLPEKAFETIVPVLLVLALVLVILQPRIQRWTASRMTADPDDVHDTFLSPTRTGLLTGSTFLVGIYGGYFTAAQGILLMGAMGVIVNDKIQRLNAAKNLLSLIVNVVAAVAYTVVAFDRINWAAAGLIAIGSLAGGVIGAKYGRTLSPTALRAVIVIVGIIGLWRLLA
ncbi:sulfite exporter TauE/SafE family protein [Williamsia soli]|uniref:sulfite exporter TauE/SafE family protein n=1 Tax=Williamsia soli TaxID=364929 RepID=UPI001A9F465D|nr:sulfite exporter TauE/SafE family protein [Williamsia soli]